MGPHRIPDGSVLTLTATSNGSFYAFIWPAASPDSGTRDGSYVEDLTKLNWIKQNFVATSQLNNHDTVEIYTDCGQHGSTVVLPAASGADTVVSFAHVEGIYSCAGTCKHQKAPNLA